MAGRIPISVQASRLKYILSTFGQMYNFWIVDFPLMVNLARMLPEQVSIDPPTAITFFFVGSNSLVLMPSDSRCFGLARHIPAPLSGKMNAFVGLPLAVIGVMVAGISCMRTAAAVVEMPSTRWMWPHPIVLDSSSSFSLTSLMCLLSCLHCDAK